MTEDLPRIRRVLPGAKPLTLVVDWQGGRRDAIDLTGLTASDPLFASLADPDVFAGVEAIDWGIAVSWPGGVEYSGTNLRRLADAQRPMNGTELADFQKARGVSNQETANLLGRSLSIVKDYKAGRQPIPLTVATTIRSMWLDDVVFAAHYRPARKPGRPRTAA